MQWSRRPEGPSRRACRRGSCTRRCSGAARRRHRLCCSDKAGHRARWHCAWRAVCPRWLRPCREGMRTAGSRSVGRATRRGARWIVVEKPFLCCHSLAKSGAVHARHAMPVMEDATWHVCRRRPLDQRLLRRRRLWWLWWLWRLWRLRRLWRLWRMWRLRRILLRGWLRRRMRRRLRRQLWRQLRPCKRRWLRRLWPCRRKRHALASCTSTRGGLDLRDGGPLRLCPHAAKLSCGSARPLLVSRLAARCLCVDHGNQRVDLLLLWVAGGTL